MALLETSIFREIDGQRNQEDSLSLDSMISTMLKMLWKAWTDALWMEESSVCKWQDMEDQIRLSREEEVVGAHVREAVIVAAEDIAPGLAIVDDVQFLDQDVVVVALEDPKVVVDQDPLEDDIVRHQNVAPGSGRYLASVLQAKRDASLGVLLRRI